MTFPYKCFYTKNVGARLLVMFLQLKIVNPVPTALYQDVTEAVIRHLKYTPKKKKASYITWFIFIAQGKEHNSYSQLGANVENRKLSKIHQVPSLGGIKVNARNRSDLLYADMASFTALCVLLKKSQALG